MIPLITLITTLAGFLLLLILLGQQSYALRKLTKEILELTHKLHHEQMHSLLENQHLQQNTAQQNQKLLHDHLLELQLKQRQDSQTLNETIQQAFQQHRTGFDEHQIKSMKLILESLQNFMQDQRSQIHLTLSKNTESITLQLEKLTQQTSEHLRIISGQVEKRLAEGFEKTTATFSDILKRLALIDEAQRRITELSSNVVSLQEILSDKSARGAFGEVQLSGLIRNVMPESTFAFQYHLSNQKRADCILFLPKPTGHIIIDAKFPLENYRKLMNGNLTEGERKTTEQQFRQDIRKHIQAIASKYIIPGETADGAIMFIPAEGVFAEIYSHYPELVEEAYAARVWMASPTTMMAILTTARAALKDDDTKKQVHVIQEHLGYLAKDFERFRKRMENLAKHIEQAHDDVRDVNVSAQKIATRFQRIEKVELGSIPAEAVLIAEESL
jgi:DNA recombination protein RmuC